MRSHTTAAVYYMQYVELYSLLVLPAVKHANEAVLMCAWDGAVATICSVRVEIRNVRTKVAYGIRRLERNDDQV